MISLHIFVSFLFFNHNICLSLISFRYFVHFAMVGQLLCTLCNRHVHSHSYSLICAICTCYTHLNCLPNVNKNDCLYTNRDSNNWFCMSCMKQALPFNHFEDDDEFYNAINEPKNAEGKIFSMIERKFSNISEISNYDETDNPLSSNDPDVNFLNEQSDSLEQCCYYTESRFHSMCDNFNVNSKNLSLMHVNVRGVQSNYNSLAAYIHSLNHAFDVVCLSETWLNETSVNNFKPAGYRTENLFRTNKSGGGVSILINENLHFKARTDLSVLCPEVECLFVEIPSIISSKSPCNVLIGVIYRPPNTSIKEFNDIISKILSSIKSENKLCYITGDININLLNSDSHLQTSEFLETMFSFSFAPLITKPTRITETTATLIDNIFSNFQPNRNGIPGICCTDISDHLPVFFIDLATKINIKPNLVKQRQYNENNKIRFCRELEETDWGGVLRNGDAQDAYTKFLQILKDRYDSCFPLKLSKGKYKKRFQWLSQGLKQSIKMKNKLYIQSLKYPTQSNICRYKCYKSKLKSLLKQAEREHYDLTFKRNKNNLKQTWRIIKTALNRNKQSQIAQEFKVDGKLVDDKSIIANKFNKYFLNIGPNLARNIPHSSCTYESFIQNPNSNSIFLRSTNEYEVINIIRAMKHASPGWDDIDTSVIKAVSSPIVTPLVHCLNLSIQTGVVPNELKLARVIPIFKKGSANEISNYRPISILPCFSKILERLMHSRLIEFLNKHDILYRYQFGFRENHSTNHALTYLIDKICTAYEHKKSSLGVFIDLSKAFDTIDHDILLRKLAHYGIRGKAQEWFKSYLCKRTQFVCYDGVMSDCGKIICGVPQGSILGPLLFLIYVNDIANVSSILHPILYADDTNLFMTGNDIDSMVDCMNEELKLFVEWLNVNKLSLNIQKTHYVIFSPGRHILSSRKNICLNGEALLREFSTTFLGVIIDHKLEWKQHIQYIKSKISKCIGILCRAKKLFKATTLVTLYYSFIYPYLSYCIDVWGTAPKKYTDSILKLQKTCCRIITGSPRRTSSKPLFISLNILCLPQIYDFNVLLFMFKFYAGLLPNIFSGMFCYCISKRQGILFRLPSCKSQIAFKSIRMQGAKVWNKFSNCLALQSSFHAFKSSLRKLLSLDETYQY